MLSQLVDGHGFEDDVSKDALPSRADDPLADGWDHSVEGVKEAVLSGIDGVDHSGRNSFTRIWLSIESPENVKGNMVIKLDFSWTCAEI